MTEGSEAIDAAKADPRHFALLYDRHFNEIFRFIRRRSGNNELAADLTQQTFLKALLSIGNYQDRGVPFKAWLLRIALNELRMHWRRKKEVSIEFAQQDARTLAMDVIDDEEFDLQKLAEALSRLPDDKAQLIELRYMDGLSYQEMAAILGITEDAAKMRTHRVLALLRTYLSRP